MATKLVTVPFSCLHLTSALPCFHSRGCLSVFFVCCASPLACSCYTAACFNFFHAFVGSKLPCFSTPGAVPSFASRLFFSSCHASFVSSTNYLCHGLHRTSVAVLRRAMYAGDPFSRQRCQRKLVCHVDRRRYQTNAGSFFRIFASTPTYCSMFLAVLNFPSK